MAEIKVVELQVKTNFESANGGIDKLKTGLKGAATESKNLSETMQGSKQSEFINQLGDGIGKLNPAFGSAVKGANGLILKMWEMVANPVGAILAGIVIVAKFLYEAFESSVAGGKELKTIFAGISAVGEQVKDAIFGLGRALINVTTAAYKFITLDFKGAAEDMKKANGEAATSLGQLADASDGTTFRIIKNLEKQQQVNDKARKMQAVVQSETNKLLVQSREILTDETASIKNKKKALEDVTKAETASSAEKVRIAKEDLKIAQQRAKAMGGEAEKKAKQELRELTIALNEAETENAMTGIKLNKQRKMLGRQEVAEQKAVNDEISASNKARHDADKTALDDKLKEESLSFQQRRDLVNKDKLITKEERRKYLDEINKQEKKSIEDHKKQIEDLEKIYKTRAEDAAANTDQKKLDLEMSRQLKVIESTAKTEEEKNKLLLFYNEEYKRKQAELYEKNEKEVSLKKSAELEKTIADKELSDTVRLEAIDAEQILLQQQLDNKIITEKEYNNKVKSLAKARITIGEEEAKAKLEQLQRGSALLNNISGMLGKSTAAGKAAAVASATIDTYAAATSAFKNAQANPISILGPAYPFIQAGLAIAGGLKNVQSILDVQVPGGGGGGGSAPTAGATPAAPQFNVVGASGANQIAQSINGREAAPIKAYVLGSDVTTQQSMNRRIVQNASIG